MGFAFAASIAAASVVFIARRFSATCLRSSVSSDRDRSFRPRRTDRALPAAVTARTASRGRRPSRPRSTCRPSDDARAACRRASATPWRTTAGSRSAIFEQAKAVLAGEQRQKDAAHALIGLLEPRIQSLAVLEHRRTVDQPAGGLSDPRRLVGSSPVARRGRRRAAHDALLELIEHLRGALELLERALDLAERRRQLFERLREVSSPPPCCDMPPLPPLGLTASARAVSPALATPAASSASLASSLPSVNLKRSVFLTWCVPCGWRRCWACCAACVCVGGGSLPGLGPPWGPGLGSAGSCGGARTAVRAGHHRRCVHRRS